MEMLAQMRGVLQIETNKKTSSLAHKTTKTNFSLI